MRQRKIIEPCQPLNNHRQKQPRYHPKELLNKQAKDLTAQSVGRQVLTPSEVKEIERLRAVATASDIQQKKLQDQFNDVNGRLTASTTEANRLRDANTTITRERDALREQLKGAPDPGAASKENAVLREQLKTASEIDASRTLESRRASACSNRTFGNLVLHAAIISWL